MNHIILKQIQAVLSEFPKIQLAILYGSFAKGSEMPTSDIDLGVAAQVKFEMDEWAILQTKLSNTTGREIDLMDLNTATGTVFKEALTKGTLIFQLDNELYAKVLSRMLFEQADFEPLRERILEERRKQVLG